MRIKNKNVIQPFLKQFQRLCEFMDEKYNDAARQHHFKCQGCPDNCCMTHFYHHTFLEYFYLIDAYKSLPDQTKQTLFEKAKISVDHAASFDKNEHHKNETRPRRMCPANAGGRCVLYKNRPMICRLHGIPYEIKRGRPSIKSPGCDDFDAQTSHDKKIFFDRTPIYIQMARLENSLKEALGISTKRKMTVAEMIVAHEESLEITPDQPGQTNRRTDEDHRPKPN